MKNKSIQVMRAFAIFSVILAHSNRTEHFTDYEALSILFGNLGIVGVPIFLVIAGYLFSPKNQSVIQFLKRKIKPVFIPWIFTGTLVYFYVTVRKGGITIISYILFIIGHGSYLYFMTILLMIWIVFLYVYKFKNLLPLYVVSIALVFIANTTYLFDLLNPYLNPIYFFHYFIFGAIINRLDSSIINFRFNAIHLTVISALSILILSFTITYKIYLTYFGIISIFYNYFFVGMAFMISSRLVNSKLLVRIGDYSFWIYLTHMPIVGLYYYLFGRYSFRSEVLLFIPIFILLTTTLFVMILGEFKDRVSINY